MNSRLNCGNHSVEFIFINDEPFMLEMNTTPGLTEESILPQQAAAAGISLSELV